MMNSKKQNIGLITVTIGILLLASGCATTRTTSESRDAKQEASANAKPKILAVENGEITVRGVKLKNSSFDIPIAVNSKVEHWIDYFTGKGRPHYARYLERSEFFVPYIKPLLKQNGMPEDLVYLAMIESGFNNNAKSRAKAVGPWQFISATGKRYGLMVNWWVDERRDVRKSTLAAIEYLRDLYSIYQSWELSAASYNAGEAKIARAIRRFGTKDFWAITRHRFLKPETRDYVPKMMAAAIIGKNPEQFGFPPVKHLIPAADEALAADGEIVKLIKTEKPEEQLPKDEAELRKTLEADVDDEDSDLASDITPATLTVVEASSTTEKLPMARPILIPHVNKQGEVGGAEIAEFEVQSPADLLKVARAAGLSYQTVKSLNPELVRWCTPPTVSTYRIKLPLSVKDRFLVTYNHEAYPRKVEFMTYRTRKGESLNRIAQHFGIRVDPISDLNGLSPRVVLRSGIKVLLPMPNDRSRSLASLEIKDPPERRKGRRVVRRSRYYRVPYKRRGAAKSSSAYLHKTPTEQING